MQTAMNSSTMSNIPTIDHIEHLTHLDPPAHVSPTPTQTYAVKYDDCIKVPSADDPVTQTWNALLQFFQNMNGCGSFCDYLSLGG